MSIRVQCSCGTKLKAPAHYAGARATCPYCGQTVIVPHSKAPPAGASGSAADPAAAAKSVPMDAEVVEPPAVDAEVVEREPPPVAAAAKPFENIEDVVEFLDPPTAPVPEPQREPKTPWVQRMFEALLDPRSIQWMLMLGGGLTVLGLIIWLASLGIFENPMVVAVAMGIGSLALLGGGWYVALETRYKIAGQALTFLACVVLPLNLWYYHEQGLITLDGRLWQAGLACCLLYVATVFVLRDPLFMYAVEVGISLTVLLLLGSLGHANTGLYVSVVFMALAVISIHAERAFAPDAEVFTRRKFGLPLFWSGQAQVGVALFVLLFCQSLGWAASQLADTSWAEWVANTLSERFVLAGGLWLVGAYTLLYSDLVVRRVGIYAYIAGFCLVMALTTLGLGFNINAETLIVVLAITGLAATYLDRYSAAGKQRLGRALSPLAMIFSCLPILLGIFLHFLATSRIAESIDWYRETSWLFVGALLVVAVANRVSAHLYRETNPRASAVYFFFSAAGLVVAAAGLLRFFEVTEWYRQAPLLMLIPIAYLVASRLWRGQSPERPLGWVAHAATAVIIGHVLVAVVTSMDNLESVFRPQAKEWTSLLLGVTFVEAAAFYVLAAYFRRKSLNIYFAMLAACAAMWQLMGYAGIFEAPYFTMIYALLGLVFLIIARVLGFEQTPVYGALGGQTTTTRGKGLPAYQGGNAVLLVAFLAAFLQSLVRLTSAQISHWLPLVALSVTTGVSVAAIGLVPRGAWRRLYVTSSVALAAMTVLTLNVLIDLHPAQKLEIVCVAIGVALLGASYVARFQESDDEPPRDMVTAGLWIGSLLAAVPLMVAVIYHRSTTGPSLPDELAIVTITILMLVTGLSWRAKSTTLIGGALLAVYLVLMIGRPVYFLQVAMGVYLAIGGALVFACGIALSVYRERLLALPERIAKREGIFRVIDWR